MEQHIADSVPVGVFPQWAVTADAFVVVFNGCFYRRQVCAHDPDVHHIAGLPVEAGPDEACGYGNYGGSIYQAGAIVKDNAVIVPLGGLGADDVQLFSQFDDLVAEALEFSTDFFLGLRGLLLLSA